jgi:hypothetical protein
MNLVDKERVPLGEVRQNADQIPGSLNRRAAGRGDLRPQLMGDDVRNARLA